MTYSQLVERSDQMATALIQAGVAKGEYVGVSFPRTIDLITSLLGVLKAGAAYVPLDPAYPVGRLETMVSSAAIRHVVCAADQSGRLHGVRVIVPDACNADRTRFPEVRDDDSVYAIFTSGSTGTPKAAGVRHSGFHNLLSWYASELALNESDRTLVISSPGFDLTQKNLFVPLLTGGTLILDEGETYDITRILRLIRENSVTLVNCTPSAFHPLVDSAAGNGFQDISSLRFAVLGGEPISIPRLRGWLEHPNCRAEVVNSYGPTECTDICLFHRMGRENLDAFPFVPLGREIPDVRVTIRDEDLEVLPDGEIGELCISGAGVGEGYLYDPEKTRGRFAGWNPACEVATPLLYRTGDLAKRLPCGTFEFRGRADHQVKVNGHRIELGEIEIALSKHDEVHEAVVTCRDHRLTAHVRGVADVESMKQHLSALLPAYMVPSEFRMTSEFPLTPNGKVDRKTLENIAPEPERNSHPVIPASEFETKILALWTELLECPVADPTANFFDLGGGSIHLAIMHVRLKELSGREFPITDLFANPSARSIAAMLTENGMAKTTNAARERAMQARKGISNLRRPTSR
ncbi:MAG: non-ribosomal peptide synthetase [Akkermansiaceae bacterium]|nr:non-ribosomal peptide synthetase [Akkermansiaceae bacterium]MCP5545343.1 non-ribosomal peptide synthetase [Akkermansiaceae bacterium]